MDNSTVDMSFVSSVLQFVFNGTQQEQQTIYWFILMKAYSPVNHTGSQEQTNSRLTLNTGNITVTYFHQIYYIVKYQVWCIMCICIYILCILYSLLSQWEFLPWEIWVAFPKESQLQQWRYPTLINYKMHAGSFRVSMIHWTLTSDMDYRIFNLCT